MDATEHILNQSLEKRLVTDGSRLELVEVSHWSWGGQEPNTYIDGCKLIDEIWALWCLEIGGVKMMPFGESIGNHRTIIFDVPMRSPLGQFKQRVVHSGCRRLNCQTSILGR